MTRATLALLALLAAGCARPATAVYLLEPDTTRWVDPTHTRPYGLVWSSGTLNLWNYNTLAHACDYRTMEVLPYDAAYRATLPLGWATGSPITGTLTSWHSSDSLVTVTGGTLTATVSADTITGVLTTNLIRSCSAVTDTINFRLIRVP